MRRVSALAMILSMFGLIGDRDRADQIAGETPKPWYTQRGLLGRLDPKI